MTGLAFISTNICREINWNRVELLSLFNFLKCKVACLCRKVFFNVFIVAVSSPKQPHASSKPVPDPPRDHSSMVDHVRLNLTFS